MKPDLKIIPAAGVAAEHRAAGLPPPETVAQRIQRLQDEVRALGRQQVAEMRADVMEGIETAREVAANPTHSTGIRQLAEKIVRDGDAVLLTLDAIIGRAG